MVSDGRSEPQILIRDSLFENLAYQQVVEVLTNLQKPLTCGNGT